ncbi:oxygenase MpaB family protein [Nocardia terpenica]|uniref:ER-bound oxygenase mpaB/mpaB'/Rubber oxygenase catalytic domain-containing protein n=1 Tax=Nocardia terpenica TaxID=455432 RepID=A0A164NJD4_9NOCA|nr:oxygenase MpaB family protein [Nocardia terpenica]KZM74423.1 hypothetical protein AWN90_25460 [Nocardia terpenica]NQE92973.1 DUF2236 domain-containing protein [Nocardia terpenica]
MAELSTALSPEPTRLGPDSLLWKAAGDWRIYLMTPATSLMLNMLPGVSAGVEQHSTTVFVEPWARLLRSVPQIQEGVFDPRMAERIRDYHGQIKGTDAHGERYHALSPELYYASHAVFTYTAMTMIDLFDHRLSDAEKADCYEESKIWYRNYGVSDRVMPPTWPEFQDYFGKLIAEGMENTAVTAYLLDLYHRPGAYRPAQMPPIVWRLLAPVVGSHARLLAAAAVPEICRERAGLRFSRVDRARFAALSATVRTIWPRLPERVRITPRAWYAKQAVLRERHGLTGH